MLQTVLQPQRYQSAPLAISKNVGKSEVQRQSLFLRTALHRRYG
jgi:hypothetical protein